MELQWLIRCLEPWNAQGYPIWQPTMVSDFDVTPDASPVAGGFKVAESVSKKIMQFGTLYFRPEEAEMAQCHREFWILCLLVGGLARELSGRKIRVRVDANKHDSAILAKWWRHIRVAHKDGKAAMGDMCSVQDHNCGDGTHSRSSDGGGRGGCTVATSECKVWYRA